jgi:crossover junction endodeoxyribonuclease RusA
MITLQLPMPPSTNALFANIPGRGRVKSAAYKRWITEAGWMLRVQRIAPITGRVRVTIRVQQTAKRKADIDNRIKAVLDLLVKNRVIEDDRHVEAVTAQWVSEGLTGVSVTIQSMEIENVVAVTSCDQHKRTEEV